MKRRFVLVGFCITVPLLLGAWAKEAASWRPTVVARLNETGVYELEAFPQGVAFTASERHYGWVDLRSGNFRYDSNRTPRRLGKSNSFSWTLWLGSSAKLRRLEVVGNDGHKHIFYGSSLEEARRKEVTVRVLPQQNKVMLLEPFRLLQWNWATGKLEHTTSVESPGEQTLSRDGRTVIEPESTSDTSSGKTIKNHPTAVQRAEYRYLSPYGLYSLYDHMDNRMKVVQTTTGKALWGFHLNDVYNPSQWLFSDDENTVTVQSGSQWCVYRASNGALLRRLPCVPNTRLSCLSPDGSTLYSVAGDVLYKQRTR